MFIVERFDIKENTLEVVAISLDDGLADFSLGIATTDTVSVILELVEFL